MPASVFYRPMWCDVMWCDACTTTESERHPNPGDGSIRWSCLVVKTVHVRYLISVMSFLFSERELTFTFAHVHVRSRSRSLYVVVRPSVCLSPLCLSSVCPLSSVTFVHPTQAIEIFGNVSTPFGTLAICDPSVKILLRSSQGNPSVGGLNQRG